MVGPGTQKNKAHKSGRAGRSAREKHADKKEASQRMSIKASHASHSKAERLNAARQQREKKKAAVLEQRRAVYPPRVVALLPLSAGVDVAALWAGLLAACSDGAVAPSSPLPSSHSGGGMDLGAAAPGQPQGASKAEAGSAAVGMAMTTLSIADRRKVRFTLLPPLTNRDDALAVVELGRAAEVILLAASGDEGSEASDAAGQQALTVLRSLGLPTVLGLVHAPAASGAKNSMKARAAARKRGAAALAEQLPGDYRIFSGDTPDDFRQVVRCLADSAPSVPHWRQQRPAVLADGAGFAPDPANPSLGTLLLRGYVRGPGLSANQPVHVPTAGDFLISCLTGPPEPVPTNEAAAARLRLGSGMDTDAATPSGEAPVLARGDPGREGLLARENVPDPLAGEQTWPTEAELAEAAAERKQAAASRKRRLPKGTSDYQAAWILDDDSDLSDSEEDEEGGEGGAGMQEGGKGSGSGSDSDSQRDFDTGTEVGMDYDDGEDGEALAEMLTSARERRLREADDVAFPDEVETPLDVPARDRFSKYRGLKSYRTSPWDPKESLPQEYARVFAFENSKRAQKRARAAASAVGRAADSASVASGTYVEMHVEGVPAEAAARVCERVAASLRGAAPPLVCMGLLQHECKLSVVNFGLRKASGFADPLPNKEPLLFVTGLRSFVARPIYSSDEHGADKHKMERFLHDGRPSVATVYAPICFPPLPVLAFKVLPSGAAVLAAAGSLRDCDPDRVVLKKIVLAGFPVRVHRGKAVVRFMFHTPEDIRWFRPVDLWTKQGRRGRIREPVGTHGAMKCIFDGPLQQQDAVCMSLYKRTFPKWPEDMRFAAC